MRPKVVCLITLSLLSSGLGLPSSSLAAAQPLFTLERTTNSNRVVYEWDSAKADSVHPYWIMLNEDGHLEELNSYERMNVYGVKVEENNEKALRFHLRALPSYPLTLQKADGQASIRLMEKDWALKKVFLRVSGGLFPRVQAIELTCLDSAEGMERNFTLTPARKGTWKEIAR